MGERTILTGRNRFAVGVAGLIGIFFVAIGLWEFLAPASFFDAMAPWDPYNEHFIRDLGAVTIGLGAVLVLSVVLPGRDPVLPALLGAGVGSVFHVVSHLIDGDLDPGLIIVALVLLVAAGFAWRRPA